MVVTPLGISFLTYKISRRLGEARARRTERSLSFHSSVDFTFASLGPGMSQQLVTWIIPRADKCCRITEHGPYSQQSPATRIDAGASGLFSGATSQPREEAGWKSGWMDVLERPVSSANTVSGKCPGAQKEVTESLQLGKPGFES